MTHVDIMLNHATVITMDAKRRVIEDGALAVKNGKIVAVGETRELLQSHTSVEIIDCSGKTILPGFIDTHGHAGHALFKTIGVDTRTHWMHIATPSYHHYTTDEFWYHESRLAALERLKMGTTCGVSVISSAQRSDDPVFACNNA